MIAMALDPCNNVNNSTRSLTLTLYPLSSLFFPEIFSGNSTERQTTKRQDGTV